MSAKANFFMGQDTYGTNIQVGLSETGKAFYRVLKYNGYGKAWSKWDALEKTPEVFTNLYGKQAIKWGWNEFIGYPNSRIRLPN
jgi:hypothetical protein